MASYNSEALQGESKERYLKKLAVAKLERCPYTIPGDCWINDPTQWPSLEWPEVYEYLVESPGVFTRESMKSRKSLEAHNQFTNGWVKTVFYYRIANENIVILRAEVIPSQRLNEKPHVPWVALCGKSERVVAAHCTCMAG